MTKLGEAYRERQTGIKKCRDSHHVKQGDYPGTDGAAENDAMEIPAWGLASR